jgi:hypothetical protein
MACAELQPSRGVRRARYLDAYRQEPDRPGVPPVASPQQGALQEPGPPASRPPRAQADAARPVALAQPAQQVRPEPSPALVLLRVPRERWV